MRGKIKSAQVFIFMRKEAIFHKTVSPGVMFYTKYSFDWALSGFPNL